MYLFNFRRQIPLTAILFDVGFTEIGIIAGIIGTMIAILGYNRAKTMKFTQNDGFSFNIPDGHHYSHSIILPNSASSIHADKIKFRVFYRRSLKNIHLEAFINDKTNSDREAKNTLMFLSQTLEEMQYNPSATVDVNRADDMATIELELNTDSKGTITFLFENNSGGFMLVKGSIQCIVSVTPLSKLKNRIT